MKFGINRLSCITVKNVESALVKRQHILHIIMIILAHTYILKLTMHNWVSMKNWPVTSPTPHCSVH